MLQHPQLSDAEVVFDGKAFYGVHAGCTWPGGEDGPTITFTERAENADDAITQLCDACVPQSPSYHAIMSSPFSADTTSQSSGCRR